MKTKILLASLLACSALFSVESYAEPVKQPKVHIVKMSKARLLIPSLNKKIDANDSEVEVWDDDNFIVQTHQYMKVKKPVELSDRIKERLALARWLVLTRLAYPNIS